MYKNFAVFAEVPYFFSELQVYPSRDEKLQVTVI